MKILRAFVLAVLGAKLMSAVVSAQTNVFPASGNVGIGTTVPGYKLDVNGTANLGSYLNGSGGWVNVAPNSNALGVNPTINVGFNLGYNRSGGDAEANFGYSNYLQIAKWNGATWSEKMRVDTNGNVGIGTTSPGSKLHVVSATNGDGLTVETTGDTAPSIKILAGALNANARNWGITIDNVMSGDFGIEQSDAQYGDPITAGTIRLYIKNDGRVGIGTTGPGTKLDIKDSFSEILIGDAANGVSITGGGEPTLNLNPTPNPGNSWTIGTSWTGGYVPSKFYIKDVTAGTYPFVIANSTGNVGIGTTNPTYPLTVNGTVRAKEVIVETGWSDYVFDPEYRLMPLAEVEQHIRTERHLPGIPAGAEVKAGGVSVGDMQARLLAKIEELTLHQIEQEKRSVEQERQIRDLREELRQVRQGLAAR